MSPRSEEELLSSIPNHFTFTVIRHPFDRLVSAYRDRILDGCTGQAKYHVPKIFKKTRKTFLAMGGKSRVFDSNGCVQLFPTFQEFIQYVVETKPENHDVHWISYNKVSRKFTNALNCQIWFFLFSTIFSASIVSRSINLIFFSSLTFSQLLTKLNRIGSRE